MGALSLHLRVALVIMGALLVVSVVAYCQDASKPADSKEKVLSSLADTSNEFAWNMLAVMPKDDADENMVFSPAAAYLPLLAAREGSAGRTREQFDEVLRLDRLDGWPDRDIAGECKEMLVALRVAGQAPWNLPSESPTAPCLSIAQSLWGRQGLHWNSECVEKLDTHFMAPMRGVDFQDREGVAKQVNLWVSENTRGKIPAILSPEAENTIVCGRCAHRHINCDKMRKNDSVFFGFTEGLYNMPPPGIKVLVQIRPFFPYHTLKPFGPFRQIICRGRNFP